MKWTAILTAAFFMATPALAEVNLNTGSQAELESLPGIGPKKAEAIIEARPIEDMNDFDKVPGIGPKTMEKLEPMITFDQPLPDEQVIIDPPQQD